MLTIQFINYCMSDSKLRKVVKKYNEKFDLTKQHFTQFVTTRVELTKQECTEYLHLIDQLIDQNEPFDEAHLYHLLHLLSAFQEGHDISSISDQQLTTFTKIKFKQKVTKPNNKELQKIQVDSVQHKKPANNPNTNVNPNTKISSSKPTKNQVYIEKSKTIINNQNQIQDQQQDNLAQKAKHPNAYQRKGKHYACEIDDEDQEPVHPNQNRNQVGQREKQKQVQIQKIEKNQQIDTQKQYYQTSNRTKPTQNITIIKKQSLQSERSNSTSNQSNKSVQMKNNQSSNNKAANQFNRNEVPVPLSVSTKTENNGRHLSTIDEQKSQEVNFVSDSVKINRSQPRGNDKSGKLEVIEAQMGKQLVNITKFQKTGQDFMNPVIKYQIVYKDQHVTWRRYSEIEKLLAYLRVKYEGIVLPEMPPKQGIKGNLTYFWKSGVNEQFLDQRKEKLKHLLNRVLACEYVSQDQVLDKFLSDEEYELPNMGNSSDSYFQALFGLKDIVFNYNQLKDYGMAYYNYISEFKKKPINSKCSQQFDKLQGIMASILAVNEHRIALNLNFEKRRQIMYDSNVKPKGPIKTDLDKILEQAEIECHELNMEYSRYLQLKSTQGWENQLIKQKSTQGGDALQKIKENHAATTIRISKTQTNLLTSMKKFSQKNEKILQTITKQIMDWRRKAHP